MPSRPSPPATQQRATLPLLEDAATAKAVADLHEQIRAIQSQPAAVTCDGRRPFKLGGDSRGDLYYRAGDGTLSRLAPGTAGQVLTMGADGLPRWA